MLPRLFGRPRRDSLVPNMVMCGGLFAVWTKIERNCYPKNPSVIHWWHYTYKARALLPSIVLFHVCVCVCMCSRHACFDHIHSHWTNIRIYILSLPSPSKVVSGRFTAHTSLRAAQRHPAGQGEARKWRYNKIAGGIAKLSPRNTESVIQMLKNISMMIKRAPHTQAAR